MILNNIDEADRDKEIHDQSCWNDLSEYVEMVGRSTTDFVFLNALEMRDQFEQEDANGLTEEEEKLWEMWWIDNFRQQIHLEIGCDESELRKT